MTTGIRGLDMYENAVLSSNRRSRKEEEDYDTVESWEDEGDE